MFWEIEFVWVIEIDLIVKFVRGLVGFGDVCRGDFAEFRDLTFDVVVRGIVVFGLFGDVEVVDVIVCYIGGGVLVFLVRSGVVI